MDEPPRVSPASGRASGLAELLEFVPDATLAVDRSGRIVLCNQQAAELFGYTCRELSGTPVDRLVPAASQARHSRLRDGYVAKPSTRRMGLRDRLSARHRSGAEIPVEVSLTWLDGAVHGEGVTLAAVRDVTARVEQEQLAQRLRDELQQARRLESLGQLAGGVAHDFNNLLAVIMNFSDLASRAVPDGSEAAEDIAEIRRAAERGQALTRKLLIVGRRDLRRPDRLDLAAVLTALRPLLLSAIGSTVSLELRLGSTRFVLADLAQIEQVVVNLVVNARDAMPSGGTLRIETSDLDVQDGDVQPGPVLAPGPYVRLAVTDDGIGMSDEVRAAAFDPFFTTKPAGQGTGLGLSTVYGIVEDTGGHLTLESTLGDGTTVTVLLPAFDAAQVGSG